MKVLAILAKGFEDLEALGTIALLRRAEIVVFLCSTDNTERVQGKYGLTVEADILLKDVNLNDYDALFIPGGMPGVSNLYNNPNVQKLVTVFCKQDKLICAICAGPSIPGRLGLLSNKTITCYPGFEEYCIGAVPTNQSVEIEDKFITGKAAGCVHEFAFAIIEKLLGNDKALKIKKDIYYNEKR